MAEGDADLEYERGLACIPHDLNAAIAHIAAAIRGYTAAGAPCSAAMASARLGDVYRTYLGNRTAARVWFQRAQRLVADVPDCVEQGWVALAGLGCEVDDPAELLRRAELALDRARAFGDANLEAKALADGGLALVQAGRAEEGMAQLDEAMALICAESRQGPDELRVLGQSVCSFFTACYHSCDFDRAEVWREPLRQIGLMGTAAGSPAFLSSHCDAVHAAALMELGRWDEADAVLQRAIADFERVMGPSWHPAIALADLRVRQGRLREAEQLLLGKDASIEALLPMARLHVARGELDLAAAAAQRGLRAMRDDRLRALELLTVLADVALATGDAGAAARAAADLEERARAIAHPIITARAAWTSARVLAATGQLGEAIAALEAALPAAAPDAAPWLRANLLVELAALRRAAGDDAGAVLDGKAAAALLEPLDAVLDQRLAATLDAILTGGDVRARASVAVASLRRDGRWWEASAAATTVRLPDTKGLRYIAALVERPGVERHALDLVDRVEGVGSVDRRHLGDAGPLADQDARRAYRRQIESLRAEIDDAVELGALDEAERLQRELDTLVFHLAASFGLGGAVRTAGSAAEKARLNVTRAIRAASAKLAEALPDAGAALDRHIRTGLFSAYEPAHGEIRWIVQPSLNGSSGS